MRNASVVVVAVLSFLVPLAAAARPCDAAGSLVPNCGFDTETPPWYFTSSATTWVGDDCATGPGCVELDRHDGVFAVEAFGDCVPVDASAEYVAGGSLRRTSGTVTQTCFVDPIFYSDGDCGSFVGNALHPFLPGPNWGEQVVGVTSPVTAQAAQLRIACHSEGADFVVRLDDGLLLPAVFADGFRTGNTSRWSSSAP